MPPRQLDIVVLSDFRFPGGTGTAIAEGVKAASQSGYSVGLIHLEAADLGLPSPVNPRIRALGTAFSRGNRFAWRKNAPKVASPPFWPPTWSITAGSWSTTRLATCRGGQNGKARPPYRHRS